jgi:hypothetical protein
MFSWAVLLLWAITAKAVSPESLNSDISILIHNDLLGKVCLFIHGKQKFTLHIETESPLASSGVLILDARPWKEATESCQKLGESVWGAHSDFKGIQSNLDYLVFQGKYARSQRFWTSTRKASTIDTNGHINTASANTRLPVLCTQSAPHSNKTFQDTNSQWQVSVHSNNEYLTG